MIRLAAEQTTNQGAIDYAAALTEQTDANTALNAEDGPQAAYDSAVVDAASARGIAAFALTASNTASGALSLAPTPPPSTPPPL